MKHVKFLNVLAAAALVLSWAAALPLSAQTGGSSLRSAIYDSWHSSRKGDTAVYRIKGSADGADRMERVLLERSLEEYVIQVKMFQGDRELSEKTERLNPKEIERNLDLKKMSAEGIEISQSRETVLDTTLLQIQVWRHADGREERYTSNVPMGGMYRVKSPEGEIVLELVEIQKGRVTPSAVSEIGRKPGKTGPNQGALTVGELIRGMESTPGKASPATGPTIVLGNVRDQPESAAEAENFLHETQIQGGLPSSRFMDNSILLIEGLDHLNAAVRYFYSESVEPSESEVPEIPRRIEIRYAEHIPSKDPNGTPQAVFITTDGENETRRTRPVNEKPYPDMLLFEMAPEAITTAAGTFNCFHMRFVNRTPKQTINMDGDIRQDTLEDRKSDLWISSVKGYTAVIRRIDTEQVTTSRFPDNNSMQVMEKSRKTIIRKWTIEDYLLP